jgi:hypothetical protein
MIKFETLGACHPKKLELAKLLSVKTAHFL